MTKQIKVLMVDDEKRFRETTQKILRKKGFETILAESGEDAITKLVEKPDVVVLDIKMPGIDGHEALARIKARNPDLPVIMLTGHGDMPSAEVAFAEGAFDYLSKPCDIDILSAKIKEACTLKKAPLAEDEKQVSEVMIPISEYTTINEKSTIKDAITALKKSFKSKLATNQLMETGHRSVLVIDTSRKVIGIMTIRDMLDMMMPAYLTAPKPSLADSIVYSPMFWKGMFRHGVIQMQDKSISDVMSPSPVSIEGTANLMEAAYMMIQNNERRLIVTRSGESVGIIREQDLFFEMERILGV